MESDHIQRILEQRRGKSAPAEQANVPVSEEEVDNFYSILIGEAVEQHYLELRFKTGMKGCYAYSDLGWFYFDPESGTIDLDFAGQGIAIFGRGIGEKLFEGIKRRRVSWIREADSKMEDNKSNQTFIQEIRILTAAPEETEAESERQQ